MARNIRTDIHRPGTIVPANYRHVMFFSLAHSDGGHPQPSSRVNCETEWHYIRNGENPDGSARYDREYEKHTSDRCCIAQLRKVEHFVNTGGVGKCSVCGAHFTHGAVFAHSNGDHLFIGHQCADKYEMMADWAQAELDLDRVHKANAKAIATEQNRISRAKFLAENPGLEEALGTEHHIVADIRGRFMQQCHLSDKQVALVLKLHQQVTNPKPRVEEVNVPAPTGRIDFTGTIVSARVHEGDWGASVKITVKVATPAGIWLAWGTCPALVCESCGQDIQKLRGATVSMKATLKPGRDAHFAIMSRPYGVLVAPAATEMKAG